jgi:hypothetical protein
MLVAGAVTACRCWRAFTTNLQEPAQHTSALLLRDVMNSIVTGTCMLLAMSVLAGCASPSTSALPIADTASGPSRPDTVRTGGASKPLILKARRQYRTRQVSTGSWTRVASQKNKPPGSVPEAAVVPATDASPDEGASEADPAEVENARSRLSRSMEELYRKWNNVARRAIRSICSGC